MTLHLTDISFSDFRSYETLQIHDIGALSVFVGPNAVGKTNIIEGIQLLTALTTSRNASVDQLIRRNASKATLSVKAQDDQRLLDVSLLLEDREKHYQLNGKAKKLSELKGLLPSVTFTPDDLNLAKGPMSVRRHALDVLGSQLNANYHLILKDYEKVLSHKNKLLKETPEVALLDSVDEMLVVCAAQLTCYRAALFEKLSEHIKKNYARLSGGHESLDVWFVPSWETFNEQQFQQTTFNRDQARSALREALGARRNEEIERRRALVGSHADEMHFAIDGLSLSTYASQGQQRSFVLAYKLAEATVIKEVLEQNPILLLDDVMSELDATRREALIDYIAHDIQSFITTANLAYFDSSMLSSAQIMRLPMQ